MPSFGSSEFSIFAYKRQRYEELRQAVETRRSNRDTKLLREQIGTISAEQLHRQIALASLREGVYNAWQANFSPVVDITDAMGDLIATTSQGIPKIPEQPYYPTPYIHLGEHARLMLNGLNRSVEGIFIRPYRAPDGELPPYDSGKRNAANEFVGVPVGFQLLACTAPAKTVSIRSLRDWSVHLSAFTCSSLVAGKLHHVDGDPDITDHPAVDLAYRIALNVFVDNLPELGRSAPPKPEGIVIKL